MDFRADLSLFLVFPVGFPEYTTLIIAVDKEDAQNKSLLLPTISSCVSLYDCEIMVKNASVMFANQGYSVFIAREGVYH